MDRRADVIKRRSDADPVEAPFEAGYIGALVECAEFEAWLATKVEAHLVMQAVGDFFVPDEVAQMEMLAYLSDMLATTGQMRGSA